MRSYDHLPAIEPVRLARRRLNVFLVLSGLFLGTLTMLNLLGISRFIVLGRAGELTFAVAVGVLPYPLTFLCTDLLSEFYGRRRANAVVWAGLMLNVWVVFILWLGGALPGFAPNDAVTGMPPVPQWNPDVQAYEETGWTFYQIQHLAFGAVTASMVAYLAAQFIDVQLFHIWKRLSRGRWLWLRNNGSTLVSQLVDTFAVIVITHFYAHALPVDDAQPIWPQLWVFIGTGYVFKAVAALLDTPIIYAAVWLLGPYLRIDPTQMHEEEEPAVLLVESA